MSFSYPISVNLFNKICSVVGGGKVAERKILSLLSAGAIVKLISPQATEMLENLASQKKIYWIKDNFNPILIKESFLVIVATNDRQINHLASRYCQDNNILVNVIDSTEDSNFIVNAIVKQGDLMLCISTNGKSPALSRKIKEDLQKQYGPEYAILLKILGEVRDMAKEIILDEKRRNEFLKYIVQTDIVELIRAGSTDEARERVRQCLLSY